MSHVVNRILDCCCLGACLASGHSDPYCLITLLYPDGVRCVCVCVVCVCVFVCSMSLICCRSEAKRTQVKKKTIDPQFNEFFTFTVSTCNMSDVIIRVSLWHQSLLTDDTFLGQVQSCFSVAVVKVMFLGKPSTNGDGTWGAL